MNLPEIREAEAPPDVAAIYAEIRTATGLPLVNLIWRRFAAEPGILPWAWDAVRPLVLSSALEDARRRLATGISLPTPGIADWQNVGCSEADRLRVGAIVAAYTRGNLTNLLALTALRLRLADPGAASAVLSAAEGPSPVPVALVPLRRLTDLPPDVADDVRALAARHNTAPGVIPSLYLHLALWPALLRALPVWLAPLYAPDVLAAARDATRVMAEEEAKALLPPALPPPASEQVLRSLLDEFTCRLIPELLPVCLALGRLRVA